MGLKTKDGYYSCWYNRFQGTLCLIAFLTFGIGDAITCIWMIEQRGINGEGNFFVQFIILNYGVLNFIGLKILSTFVFLFIPFLILRTTYWMLNGFFVSFSIFGTLGMILNIEAARNEPLLLSPGQVIFLFISLVMIFTSIGEQIDKSTNPRIRPYIDCLLKDIAVILISILSKFKKNNN